MRRMVLVSAVACAFGIGAGWLLSSTLRPSDSTGPPLECTTSVPDESASDPIGREGRLVTELHSFIDCFSVNAGEGLSPTTETLEDALGVLDDCSEAIEPGLTPIVDERLEFEIWAVESRGCSSTVPISGLLARPSQQPGPYPLVIVIHGTAASPELLFGLESADAFEPQDYHGQLAIELLGEGYAVFAPRIVTDRESTPMSGLNQTRNDIDRRARSIGLTLVGLELTAIEGALTQISALNWIDETSIGSYGISLGGMLAFYHAAIDSRVDAVVVSQWIEDRAKKLIGFEHPDALWRMENADYALLPLLPTFDDVSVASLIAPRAIFIEAGSQDSVRTEFALEVWPEFQSAFVGTAPNSVCLEVTPGGHEVWFESSRRFLAYWLLGEQSDGQDLCPFPD